MKVKGRKAWLFSFYNSLDLNADNQIKFLNYDKNIRERMKLINESDHPSYGLMWFGC